MFDPTTVLIIRLCVAIPALAMVAAFIWWSVTEWRAMKQRHAALDEWLQRLKESDR